MYVKVSLVLAAAVLSFASPLFAVDAPLTVPTLGIDWAGSVTALTTAVGTIIVAALGLWAGLKIVMAAKRFIGGSVSGR